MNDSESPAKRAESTAPDLARFDQPCRAWLARHSASLAAFRRPDLEQFGAWCSDRGIDPLSIDRAGLDGYRDDRRPLSTISAFFHFAERHNDGVPGFSSPFRP